MPLPICLLYTSLSFHPIFITPSLRIAGIHLFPVIQSEIKFLAILALSLIHISFSYKGFTLSFLIDARIGGKVVSATQAVLDSFGASEQSAKARDNGGCLLYTSIASFIFINATFDYKNEACIYSL